MIPTLRFGILSIKEKDLKVNDFNNSLIYHLQVIFLYYCDIIIIRIYLHIFKKAKKYLMNLLDFVTLIKIGKENL